MNDHDRSDQSLLSTIIGTPRWWLVHGVAVVLLVAAVAVVGPGESRAAGPVSTVAASAAMEPICGPGNELECKKWTKKKIKQFKAGKLGNAKGYKLPRKIRRMLDKKQGRAGGFSGRFVADDDWWDYPGNVVTCLAYGGRSPSCDQASETRRKIAEKTVGVTIVCGGAGVIGFLGKGGWWGLGTGTLGCLWAKFAARWW